MSKASMCCPRHQTKARELATRAGRGESWGRGLENGEWRNFKRRHNYYTLVCTKLHIRHTSFIL